MKCGVLIFHSYILNYKNSKKNSPSLDFCPKYTETSLMSVCGLLFVVIKKGCE